jgi:hypothetical protein
VEQYVAIQPGRDDVTTNCIMHDAHASIVLLITTVSDMFAKHACTNVNLTSIGYVVYINMALIGRRTWQSIAGGCICTMHARMHDDDGASWPARTTIE